MEKKENNTTSDVQRVIEILKSGKEYRTDEERCCETGLFTDDCHCWQCELRDECSAAK